MYCKNCGSYMEKGQFVCIKCGARQDVNDDMINNGGRSTASMTSGSPKSWFHPPTSDSMGDGGGGWRVSSDINYKRPPVPDYNRVDSGRGYNSGPGMEAAAKKRPRFLIPLIAGGGAVLAIVIVVVVLFMTGILGGGSAKDVAVKAMKAKYSNNVDGYIENLPEDFIQLGGGRDIIKQRLKSDVEDAVEDVAEECGEKYKVKCSAERTEKLSKEEMEYEDLDELESMMGWSTGSIEEVQYVYVNIDASGSAGEYHETRKCYIIKYKGKCYFMGDYYGD